MSKSKGVKAVGFIIALAVMNIVGVVIINAVFSRIYINILTQNTIGESISAFETVEQYQINLLSSSLHLIMENRDIGEMFQKRDRQGLIRYTRSIYKQLKEQNGITHWYFINPNKRCFLRIHKPELYDDVISRSTLESAVKTNDLSVGKDLGKTAMAIRAVHPYYYQNRLIGYIELGVEYEEIFNQLRKQTLYNYGLIIKKKYISQLKWNSIKRLKAADDTWEDESDFVLIKGDKSKVPKLKRAVDNIGVSLEDIPEEGLVITDSDDNGDSDIQGVFPFFNSQGKKVGFVLIRRGMQNMIGTIRRQNRRILYLTLFFMGMITFLMIFFHRRGERELRIYRNQLEELVEERTASLKETNIQLTTEIEEHKRAERELRKEHKAREAAERDRLKAIKRVERSEKMASIGVMAAGITHEINQPLNAIKVTADSIAYWNKQHPKQLPESMVKQMGLISKSVERISQIIKHMRDFWIVPDATGTALIDIQTGISNAMEYLKERLKRGRIIVHVDTNGLPLPIHGNLIHIEQIFINLIMNAINAFEQSDIENKEIRIETDQKGDLGIITLSDNGPGLPSKSIEELTDPFFSERGDKKGMGLGLAIVHRYIVKYGGKLQLGKDVSEGTAFRITFPLRQEERE